MAHRCVAFKPNRNDPRIVSYMPIDGRATVRVGDKPINLRISVIPTSHGERVVLRLLDKSARLYRMPSRNWSQETRN